MDLDSPPSSSIALPNESNPPGHQNADRPAQARGVSLLAADDDDVDMDGESAGRPTSGVKGASGGKNGQEAVSGPAGTSADKAGFGNMASFFQPRKANGSGGPGAKGKGREAEDAEYTDEIEKRGGLPW
jgi:hypothetical protein